MAQLSLPDDKSGKLIDPSDIKIWTNEQLLKGYLIVNGSFQYPKNVKDPSIPCYVDKTTAVYPFWGDFVNQSWVSSSQKSRMWNQY
jgi:hypothetical protein